MSYHVYKKSFVLFLLVSLAALLTACQTAAPPATVPAETTAETTAESSSGDVPHLLLATTTSTQDSGLLDVILPVFEKQYGAKVDVVAVGTGQALALGASGDADVVLVHARSQEDAFVKAGDGKVRYDVMYNDFVIVGPSNDPAKLQGMKDAVEAFKTLASAKAAFISRGDNSGTYTKEQAIWTQAGITPAGDWYISAGQGMGEVLTMTEEQQAYTLSDRATYLSRQAKGLKLNILVEGDPLLFNPYGVIPVNPDKHPTVHAELAQQFADWITSVETQQLIASYQINGQQLFFPSSDAWKAAQGASS
jgi:tungstate transport system substrate-binding protein